VTPLRILFVSGDLAPYLTTRARRDAFLALGQQLESVTAENFVGLDRRWMNRFAYWTLLAPRTFAFNRAILASAEKMKANVIWIEKGTEVFPGTLRRLKQEPSRILVYHNTDDWRAKVPLHAWQWRHLLGGLRLYDLHFTSNLHNVREFREYGLPAVYHMELAANPVYPDPEPEGVPEAERKRLGGEVGFIGHWEHTTERMLRRVAEAGLDLKIYGAGWQQADLSGPLGRAVQGRPVIGPDYRNAILSLDVNVGIVSKWNRNHTASRSFQIPALGAFLLHERNIAIQEAFREGEEAEFFGSDDELVEKCRHYVAHPEQRRRIAAAGRARCLASGYFETDRVREVLPLLERALAAKR
jgi:hypothetical protein